MAGDHDPEPMPARVFPVTGAGALAYAAARPARSRQGVFGWAARQTGTHAKR